MDVPVPCWIFFQEGKHDDPTMTTGGWVRWLPAMKMDENGPFSDLGGFENHWLQNNFQKDGIAIDHFSMADPKNGGNVWKSLKPVSYEVNIYLYYTILDLDLCFYLSWACQMLP
jgi:hypothetical protein